MSQSRKGGKGGKGGKRGRSQQEKSQLKSPSPDTQEKVQQFMQYIQQNPDLIREGEKINRKEAIRIAAEFTNGGQQQSRAQRDAIQKALQKDPNAHPTTVKQVRSSLNQDTIRYRQLYGDTDLYSLLKHSQELRDFIYGEEDYHIAHDSAIADQNNNFNINSRLSQASHDTGSRSLPQTPQLKEKRMEKDYIEQDGIQSQEPFAIQEINETDQAPLESLPQQEYELLQQKEIQSKMLISEANEAEKPVLPLEYRLGGLDWGKETLSKPWLNNPYPIMKTIHYMNDGGIPSLRTKQQVLDKSSKINRPKERKNYIKTSKLMQSIAAQEKLKKYSKKNKK
ncbi:MAG: hypothetical protein EZS28_022067 [Streblomastix strix]|uniref:Uncharacterized protein n=1 Tax=Streblomastix strix TaxID=222440 RepID=A0A5J4VIV4_9EUKA|nr:MAG: hypothetical protein EZS28_022067 [Streblomastix strix]